MRGRLAINSFGRHIEIAIKLPRTYSKLGRVSAGDEKPLTAKIAENIRYGR